MNASFESEARQFNKAVRSFYATDEEDAPGRCTSYALKKLGSIQIRIDDLSAHERDEATSVAASEPRQKLLELLAFSPPHSSPRVFSMD